jgi:hypothetical protein
VKILGVEASNRRRRFEIHTRGKSLVFPYVKADPVPSASDRVEEVLVDPELGREAFTYRLASGAEGSVHVDSVLEYKEDPAYMADLTLYRLTQQARERFEASDLSAREVARALGTSPTQLYRLLDPTNYTKSVRQLLSLLYVLGCDVAFEVTDRRRVASWPRGRESAAPRAPRVGHDGDDTEVGSGTCAHPRPLDRQALEHLRDRMAAPRRRPPGAVGVQRRPRP